MNATLKLKVSDRFLARLREVIQENTARPTQLPLDVASWLMEAVREGERAIERPALTVVPGVVRVGNCPSCGIEISAARLAEFGGCQSHPRNAQGWRDPA